MKDLTALVYVVAVIPAAAWIVIIPCMAMPLWMIVECVLVGPQAWSRVFLHYLMAVKMFLPPLLTLVVFLWAWSTIQRYILEPVEWGARSIIVWQNAEIIDDAPLVQDKTALIEQDSDGQTITFQQNEKLFVQIPSGKWIPDQVRDAVRKNPGNLSLSTANAEQYYHQYVRLTKLPRKYVLPAFILFFLILLYLLGKLLAARIGRIFLRSAEGFIQRLPFIRTVYSSVKQVTDFVFTERDIEFTRVVAVQYPREGVWSVGFVTGESMLTIQNVAAEPVLSVLMPTSPMPATGFTITIRKSEAIDLDITIDQAIQFVVSCGVVVPANQIDSPAVEVKAHVAAALETNISETAREIPLAGDSSQS